MKALFKIKYSTVKAVQADPSTADFLQQYKLTLQRLIFCNTQTIWEIFRVVIMRLRG